MSLLDFYGQNPYLDHMLRSGAVQLVPNTSGGATSTGATSPAVTSGSSTVSSSTVKSGTTGSTKASQASSGASSTPSSAAVASHYAPTGTLAMVSAALAFALRLAL